MDIKSEAQTVVQKLDLMLQAKFGGYSIKRILIIVITANLIAMLWVFTTADNFLAVLPQIIAALWVLLGYNNQEKKIELEKAKIDKQPNLENQ